MNYLAWVLPLASGFADAGVRGIIKLTKTHRLILTGFGYLWALPYYLIWLYVAGIPEIKPGFWWVIIAIAPLWAFAVILMTEAHRASPLLLTAPYLSLTSAFLLVTSPIMGAGTPTLLGGLGVLVLTVGIYVLNLKAGQASFLDPFKELKRERGAWLMLWVSVIASITSNLDYLGVTRANVPFYAFAAQGLMGLLSLTAALVYLRLGWAKEEELSPQGSWKPLSLYGAMTAASVIPQYLAFYWIPNVPYVIAGKRAGTILFSAALGIILAGMSRFRGKHERERENLHWRIPGTLLMIAGMTIIILWGRNH